MEQDHLSRKEIGQCEGIAPGTLGDRGQVGRPQNPLHRRQRVVSLPEPEREDRDGNALEHGFGDAAQQQVGKAGAPVGRHQDEIGSTPLGYPGDPGDRLAHLHFQLDREEPPELSLHDRFEPAPKLVADVTQEFYLRSSPRALYPLN